MWDKKVLIYVIFLTNVSPMKIDISKYSTPRLSLREQIIQHMEKESPNVPTETEAGSFNLCQPGIERAAICEAVATFMDLDSSIPIGNQLCADPLQLQVSFPCKRADTLLFNVKSNPRESTIRLESDGEIMDKTFAVPINEVQLVNPDYVSFMRMHNWLRLASRTDDEIKTELDTAMLPALYETAIQLTVDSVEMHFEGPEPQMKGFDLCAAHTNRVLLCEAINVRLYGESNFIANESECNAGTYPYFECDVRFVGLLRMGQGISENSVFLMNSANDIVFIVKIAMIKNSLINEKVMPTQSTQQGPVPPKGNLTKQEILHPRFGEDASQEMLDRDTRVSREELSRQKLSDTQETSISLETSKPITSDYPRKFSPQPEVSKNLIELEPAQEQTEPSILSSPEPSSLHEEYTGVSSELEVPKEPSELNTSVPVQPSSHQKKLTEASSGESKHIATTSPEPFPSTKEIINVPSGISAPEGTTKIGTSTSPERSSPEAELVETSPESEIPKEPSELNRSIPAKMPSSNKKLTTASLGTVKPNTPTCIESSVAVNERRNVCLRGRTHSEELACQFLFSLTIPDFKKENKWIEEEHKKKWRI